jgi:hypothetical protein
LVAPEISSLSFRDAPQAQTRNLEVEFVAPDSGFDAARRPGMTMMNG